MSTSEEAITEIVVISLSGIAVFQSSKVAGDLFSEEIQDHFRRHHGMSIGLKTAEQIKIQVGSVVDDLINPPSPMMVRGKSIMEGLPVVCQVDYREISGVLNKSITSIEESIVQTLETCPPELAADIYLNGIHVTGGGALLRGLKERLERTIGLKAHIDAYPLLSVSKGYQKRWGKVGSLREYLFS
ncbi:MAG: rod shape-determining protein [Bacteroidota bacterium]